MSNVIILHGKPDDWEYYDSKYPSASNSHWLPWLQKECLTKDLDAATPEVFRCFDAKYQDWVNAFTRYPINNETIVVTHSCGGGILLRYLCENKNVHIKKLIMVAPWLDPLKFMQNTFGYELFDFKKDPDLLNRIGQATIFSSDDDMESIQKSVEEIRNFWPAINYREFHNYGHFCFEDINSQEFPELLEEVLN